MRIGRERLRYDQSAELPVARGAVLARAHGLGDAECRAGPAHGRHTIDGRAGAEPEGLEVRQSESAHGPGQIAQCVAAAVAVGAAVRCGADAEAVENDDCRAPGHGREALCTNRKRSAVTV